MIIRVTIPILPKAQKRDRITARGGFARSYTDKAQRLEADKLLTYLMASRPPVPLQGEISLEIWAYLPIPKSKPRKWRERAFAGLKKPTVKPDSDNLAKQILDVMNGVFFEDDRQVTDLSVHKRYTDMPHPAQCWVITFKGD